MRERILALLLLQAVPYCAQEEVLRRPSPFPEKNRQRKSAAQVPARPSSSRSGRPASRDSGTTPVKASAGTKTAVGGNTGKACFFSATAAGRTASGEQANPAELVAAHATYALGSRARVTNLANGKAVEVRIIDRFPDSRRIISVSEAAARELGFYEAGTADVKVEPSGQDATPDGR